MEPFLTEYRDHQLLTLPNGATLKVRDIQHARRSLIGWCAKHLKPKPSTFLHYQLNGKVARVNL